MLTTTDTHSSIEVCGNEQFSLGRDVKCRYSWHDDSTISREHLRIHCILYEQDPVSDIAPFVYATDLSANGTYLKRSNAECTGSQGRGIMMGKNGTFLLDDGDELQLSETVTLVYRSLGAVRQTVLTATQKGEKTALASRYLITGRLLGEGGYGKVLIGVDQVTQRQLACKMVNLENMYDRRADLRMPMHEEQSSSSQAIGQLPFRVQKCFREFDILKDISHPNIVHVQKVFWSRSTIYMFQELVTGGDLFSYIEYRHGKISSIETAVIIRQLLKGVEYLHDHDIVHRDLKPDNILMTSLDNGARVVITDFGHARFLPDANTQRDYTSNKLRRMFSMVGTAEYAAPEIYRANGAVPQAWGYSLGVDMWSIGSIAAAVLTGDLLFSCKQDFEEDAQNVIIRLAAECDLSKLDDEYHPLWGHIGFAPKDFIKRVLVLDEEDRMSATEALDHIWFTHPMMAADFEAQYERAIKDWRPRQKDEQLIEQISYVKASPTPRKQPVNDSFDVTQSRFFPSKYASLHARATDEHQRAHYPLVDEQFASQPVPSSYEENYTQQGPPKTDHIDGSTQISEHQGADPSLAPRDQYVYLEHATNDYPIPQTKTNDRGPTSKAITGQLSRVGTTTRLKYFRREIVDLDDLDAPFLDTGEDADVFETEASRTKSPEREGKLCREETVQVRTTPVVDSEETGNVEQWWHHRYPPTQYHYDTQAEPITQDGEDVLVQETPPEVLFKYGCATKSRVNRTSVVQHRHERVQEAPFAYKINKPKKVYGRQH